MTNSEIAYIFDLTGKLSILHDDQRINHKNYEYIFKSLRRWSKDINKMSQEDIALIGDIGNTAAEKIINLLSHGFFGEYQELVTKTPTGIVELLSMKGLGAKSLRKLWLGLDIKTAEDLLLACRNNELLKLKGFGVKSQERLKQRLQFFLSMRGYKLHATLEKKAIILISKLIIEFPNNTFLVTGKLKRKEQILKSIDILHTCKNIKNNTITETINDREYYKGTQIIFHYSDKNELGSNLFLTTGPAKIVNELSDFVTPALEEKDVFKQLGIHFIPSEIRHQENILFKAKTDDFSNLIKVEDIKGSLHMHTTDSDGLNSLEEMIAYGDKVGYEYMLITDHSKSAGYANGLRPDQLLQQIDQIETLNKKYKIQVYSGIESDILSDGSLDYSNDILSQLDIVISSIHSGLVMDIQKATNRVIKAIENPYTRIMGHLTGRLLTSREGYPIDHKKVIDACAANNVVMELNANPSRLDMDEQYINYAMQKGVLISINPDAHSTSQLNMMQYGINTARRGGLTIKYCLNALNGKDFDKWVTNK